MHCEGSKWVMETELGLGTFSKVCSAVDLSTSAQVAIKYPLGEEGRNLLSKEAKMMQHLAQCESVPKLVDCSHCPDFIVMEKVGRTLLNLHTDLKRFSLKTVTMVAMKTISALEDIHTCGCVHRDVKPDNIAVALSPNDPKIYLIDMGLSYKYTRGGFHVQYAEGEVFQGTPFFCSLNALRSVRPTRRDDLEALGYVIIFLLKGDLPWFHVRANQSTMITEVLKIREGTTIKSLCQGLEPEVKEYLEYCQGLSFADKPNYDFLRSLFSTIMQRFSFELDWKYDWFPRGRHNKPKTKTVAEEQATIRIVAEKRRAAGYCMTPSQNMSVLASSIASPGEKMGSRLNFLTLPEGAFSTDESQPDLQKTPVHKINQLPSFSKPRGEADLPVEIEAPHSPVRRQRRYTCDEYSFDEIQ